MQPKLRETETEIETETETETDRQTDKQTENFFTVITSTCKLVFMKAVQ